MDSQLRLTTTMMDPQDVKSISGSIYSDFLLPEINAEIAAVGSMKTSFPATNAV